MTLEDGKHKQRKLSMLVRRTCLLASSDNDFLPISSANIFPTIITHQSETTVGESWDLLALVLGLGLWVWFFVMFNDFLVGKNISAVRTLIRYSSLTFYSLP